MIRNLALITIFALCLYGCEKESSPEVDFHSSVDPDYPFAPYESLANGMDDIPFGDPWALFKDNESENMTRIGYGGIVGNHFTVRLGWIPDGQVYGVKVDEVSLPDEFVVSNYLGYGVTKKQVWECNLDELDVMAIRGICCGKEIVAVQVVIGQKFKYVKSKVIPKSTSFFYEGLPMNKTFLNLGTWYGKTFTLDGDVYDISGEKLFTPAVTEGDHINEYEVITYETASTEKGIKLTFKQVNAKTGSTVNTYEHPTLWPTDARLTVTLKEKSSTVYQYTVDSITYNGKRSTITVSVPVVTE